ncbi:BamA/TamA family outer membrane protein, partial [Klebsiella pneumoniae]|nr:BamA/TamA family outer membrane protein [Klebsiella pneumoniae]
IVMQAQDVWIRTLYDRHRFVVRATLAGSKRTTLTRCRQICVFFAGGDRSIRGYKYKSISPKDDDGKLIGASKLATGSLEYQYN